MAGRRRTAARARVSGGWPTDPVTCPDGRVSHRPLQGLKSLRGQFFLYDLSYDFVFNGLDDFTVEKNHPGVGRGPARLKLFNSTYPEVE